MSNLICLGMGLIVVGIVIIMPIFALVAYSSWEMILEGKSYKDTIGYFAYSERFIKDTEDTND